jgi:hypothetical protein
MRIAIIGAGTVGGGPAPTQLPGRTVGFTISCA